MTPSPTRRENRFPTPAGRITAPPAPAPAFTVNKPRAGGILPDGDHGEAWTGGSNLVTTSQPTYLTQRRPYKYSASQSLLNKIEAGIDDKLGSPGEQSTCTFEHWMRLQSNAHVKFGMDTVFKVPNATWSEETNLFQCYNKAWTEI
jgi:hypothetical protein